MAYEFKMLKGVAIPDHVFKRRGGTGQAYNFPFGDMKPGSGQGAEDNEGFELPRDFWKEHAHLTDADIDRPASEDKQSGAEDIRDRIRRAFQAWKKADPKRKPLAIGFNDLTDKKGKYLGVEVFLLSASGATVRKKAA